MPLGCPRRSLRSRLRAPLGAKNVRKKPVLASFGPVRRARLVIGPPPTAGGTESRPARAYADILLRASRVGTCCECPGAMPVAGIPGRCLSRVSRGGVRPGVTSRRSSSRATECSPAARCRTGSPADPGRWRTYRRTGGSDGCHGRPAARTRTVPGADDYLVLADVDAAPEDIDVQWADGHLHVAVEHRHGGRIRVTNRRPSLGPWIQRPSQPTTTRPTACWRSGSSSSGRSRGPRRRVEPLARVMGSRAHRRAMTASGVAGVTHRGSIPLVVRAR